MARFHPGPSHELLAKGFMTRQSWTTKLATGPGPAHIASTASLLQPQVLSAAGVQIPVLVTGAQG